jgi:hypothetical protein
MSIRIPLVAFALGILWLSAAASGVGETPEQVVQKYFDAILKKEMTSALQSVARFPNLDEATLVDRNKQVAERVKRLRLYFIKALSSKVDGELAVVLFETPTTGVDPVYLIKQDGGWRVLPGLRYKSNPGISAEQVTRYEKLKAWFEAQKSAFEALK